MSLVVDEHRQYLSDPARISAYERAIAAAVRPGDRVLDLASGTGILGLFACRHGAARVYAVESGPILGLSRELARTNGFADRIVGLRGLSTRIMLPEPVDVIVTDQIGRFGFEAGLVEYVSDARDRFLRPGGRLVPGRVDLHLAPIECVEAWSQVEFWRTRPAGFDVSPAHRYAMNTGYPLMASAGQLLAAPAAMIAIDLSAAQDGSLTGEGSFVIARAGTLHGLLGGFVATLAPGVTMTNLPTAGARINRHNAYLPVAEPVAVAVGDRLDVSLRILPVDNIVRWVVRVPGGRRFAHSTLDGMLLSAEDIDKTRPDYVPELTPAGRARRSVLELCDGVRTVAEIERALLDRHPEQFRSVAQASVFVNEVIGPYASSPRAVPAD